MRWIEGRALLLNKLNAFFKWTASYNVFPSYGIDVLIHSIFYRSVYYSKALLSPISNYAMLYGLIDFLNLVIYLVDDGLISYLDSVRILESIVISFLPYDLLMILTDAFNESALISFIIIYGSSMGYIDVGCAIYWTRNIFSFVSILISLLR